MIVRTTKAVKAKDALYNAIRLDRLANLFPQLPGRPPARQDDKRSRYLSDIYQKMRRFTENQC